MQLRKPLSRWAFAVFAAALLLKSAMPFLAHASAQMQGKALVEVCSVYGVSMVTVTTDSGHAPESDHASKQGNEHCTLTALTAFAGVDRSSLAVAPAIQLDTSAPRARPSSQAPDACATWVARLKHGPPLFA
jgi:hypothetical protein